MAPTDLAGARAEAAHPPGEPQPPALEPAAAPLAAGASPPSASAIAALASDVVPLARGRPLAVLDDGDGRGDAMSFRFALYGDDLDPDDVSRRLGCAPTSARRGGEALHAQPPVDPDADEDSRCLIGAWVLEVEAASPFSIDDLVEQVLGRFPSVPAFWQPLHREFAIQLRLSFHTGARDSGFILSTESLARCAATGASLLFTLHTDGRLDS